MLYSSSGLPCGRHIENAERTFTLSHCSPSSRRRSHPQLDTWISEVLDDRLDLFADTEQRQWDIPWNTTEPGAAVTSPGDFIPQMIAAALEPSHRADQSGGTSSDCWSARCLRQAARCRRLGDHHCTGREKESSGCSLAFVSSSS
jgi:hypothetical protein